MAQRIDDILSKPVSIWIISIIVSVGLWFYVIGTEEAGEISRAVLRQVEFVNVASQLEIKNDETEVWIYVSGRENEIDDLLSETITCEVDTRGLTSGRYRLPVNVTLPRGIRLRELHPSQIDVELIRYAERLVNVEVALPHDLGEGFYLDSVEIVPSQVTIKGVERDLARIGKVRIMPTADELKSGKELFLPPELESSEPFEDSVRTEPPQVRLRAVLVSGSPRKMVSVRARMSGSPDDDYAVLSTTVDPAEVLVEGPKAALDKLTSLETSTVEISGIKESTSMAVPVRAPGDKSITVLGEGTVRVTVTLQPKSAAKQIINVPIEVAGGGGVNWKVFPQAVTVTVEGLPSAINGPAAASLDIKAYVNAENLFSKQAVLPVRTRINSDLFKVTAVDPYTVSITGE